ncbi:BatD family protein [Alteromonas sp. C1M14]|uniref:BatD family protein n=1 Tax=Alteromonas sp. C1M14 TaxID=2841567 RepID=UPI0020910A16|nr:BatD family protein [Alteromonas sp. C1M14]
MKNIRIVWLLLLLRIPAVMADVSEVEATIDKNPVMVDEAIQLTVIAHGDANRDAFDSSPLLKDFVVGRTAVSSQTRIINFDKEETTTWTTTLFPRGEGNFTIPALTVEGKQTQPITVRVIPVKNGTGQSTRDYYVTTNVDTENVYLHQQLLYTTKLYLSSGIERGSLQAPDLTNAQIQQLGEDKQYSDIVNGKRYQVIERNYAIVPQASGQFTIKGPVFSGDIVVQDPNTSFGFFNRTKQINRRGPDVSVEVKPVPADIDYHWLPSEYVSINEEWPQNQQFMVGEPITRTITLTAMGVVEEQLPELPQVYPPAFKLYPDQANTATVNKNNTLIAQRVESLAMIPNQAGQFVLPKITVPWFNVLTGETEYATLPAKSITVAPAAAGSNAQGAVSPPVTTTPASPSVQPKAPIAPPPMAQENPSNNVFLWIFIILWLMTLAGWSATVIYFRRKLINTSQNPLVTKGTVNTDEKNRFHQLKHIAQTGTPGQIQQAWKQWRQCLQISTENVDAQACESQIQQQINAMLANQFGQGNDNIDKTKVIKNIVQLRTLVQRQQPQDLSLQSLYPQSTSP